MTSAPAMPDLHEKLLDDVNTAIDRMTFGAAREDVAAARGELRAPRFERILACEDASPTSAHVQEWAAHLARMHGAHVTVASIAPAIQTYDGPLGAGGYWPGMIQEYERVERTMAEHARHAAAKLREEDVDAEAVTRVGGAAHEIAKLAREGGADLVIVGAKGGGPVSRVVLGSVAESLTGRVPASMLIARTSPRAMRVLAATDGGAASARAVAAALAYASEARADLFVQHVVEYDADPSRAPPEGHLKAIVERMALPTPPRVRYFLDVGRPAEAIVERAKREGCDLIVMGARGLGRVRGALLGSVSHRVANAAVASVLLLRAPEP